MCVPFLFISSKYETHLFLLGSSDVFFFFFFRFQDATKDVFFASVVFSLLVDTYTAIRHWNTP